MDDVPGIAGATQGGGFDSRQAAALLDQATRRARRALTPLPPLLFIGPAGAAAATAFRYWPLAGTCLAITVTAAVAGFGGPAGSWLITGIGVGAVYLGIAAFTAWRRRGRVEP